VGRPRHVHSSRNLEDSRTMSLVDYLKGLWQGDANHWVIAEIPADHTDASVAVEPIVAEDHYVRLWLSEMFLKNDRKLFREFQPVVHSSVRLTYGSSTKELPYVAGPQDLGLGENTLGQGVRLDHRLTNLLPFNGGSVDISAALVAYKDK